MTSVALYARVSSEQQSRQATIASQVAALQERAQTDGVVVLPSDIYVDDGYSGSLLVRPALERLRDRAAQGGLEVLYVHSPDRLARRYAYQVLLLDEFAKEGVRVVFVLGPAGHSAEDELLVQVQGMIAEYERAKILERSRRGKIHKARLGSVNSLSGAPYGYTYVRKTNEGPASYQILLHEAKIVRQMFQWFVEDQVSIAGIARRLQGEGIPTRAGRTSWGRSTLSKMLNNPAYMGQAAFGKTEKTAVAMRLRPIRGRAPIPRRAKSTRRSRAKEEWIPINVPALISEQVFVAAQEQLERNRRLSARNGRGQRYLLQGLTVCARCGYAYYGKVVSLSSRKKHYAYPYYRCFGTDAHRFGGTRVCQNPQVRVDSLDSYVWNEVKSLLENPERVLEEWTRRGADDGTMTELRARRDEARRFVSIQEQILRRLLDAYEAGALSLAELTDRSERIRARIHTATEDLASLESDLAHTIELSLLAGRFSDFAAQVTSGIDRLDWPKRRQLIRTLVARIEISEEGATVVYRIPSLRPNPDGAPPESNPTGASGKDDRFCQLRPSSAR